MYYWITLDIITPNPQPGDRSRCILGPNQLGLIADRTSVYLDDRLQQDHRGIKGRIQSMRGFIEHGAADRYCREHDELRNFLRCRSRMRQHVPAATRRWQHMRKTAVVLHLLATA